MSLIAIVGADGAGKSTVVKAMRAEISKFRSVSLVDKWDILDSSRFNEYRFLSTELNTLRACVAEMRDINRTLFLFWALHGSLTPARRLESDVILLDGYWPKHAAAEIAYSAPPSLVEALSAIMPRADLTILLDVDPAIAYSRRNEDEVRGIVSYECGLEACSREAFITHQTKIREMLLPWAKKHDWHVVDANRSLDEVIRDVVGVALSHVEESGK